MGYKIFVINTGSTSTKIALFEDGMKTYEKEIQHPVAELKTCAQLADQLPLRRNAIEQALLKDGVDLSGLSAVAARGGTFGFAKGGAYLINEDLAAACRYPVTNHASNLSALLAWEIAKKWTVNAYIYDAVCTNEVSDIARFSGLKDVKRRPFSHVLNTRGVARKEAERQGKKYEDMNFIIAHLGGGISINVHSHGRIVDLICDDEGPMSPERAGGLNTKALIDLCFSGDYTKASIMKRTKGAGGLIDHLGTSDLREVEKRIANGDSYALQVFDAMAYQIAKGIAALAAVVSGKVDCVILTGGCAKSKALTDRIAERVAYLAPVVIQPGAIEMEALACGITRVLNGTEQAKIWGE